MKGRFWVLWISILIGIVRADDVPPSASSLAPSLEGGPSWVDRGMELLIDLHKKYPDEPGSTHKVDLGVREGILKLPYLELSLSSEVWNGLSSDDQKALVASTRYELTKARRDPDSFISVPKSAPVYSFLKDEIQSLPDDAWRISVGHMDSAGAFVVDKVVKQGVPDASPLSDVPGPASTPAPPSESASATVPQRTATEDPNRLNEIIQTFTTDGVNFIKSYQILSEYQRVDIQIDSSFWDQLSHDQQLRICDSLATTDFLEKMNLLDAHLFIDSTEVGSISRNMFGGGNSFSPDDRYWNNR